MSSPVIITRSVSTLALERATLGALYMIRVERESARLIAKTQLHAQPRMMGLKATIRAGYPVMDLQFTFTDDLGQHHYKPIGRCEDCRRRWGEHADWEKAK